MKRGHHTRLDRDVRQEIRWLESLPEVPRVILGRQEACRHKASPGTLKVQAETKNGFKVRAYTGYGMRELFVVVEPLDRRPELIRLISERYEKFHNAQVKRDKRA